MVRGDKRLTFRMRRGISRLSLYVFPLVLVVAGMTLTFLGYSSFKEDRKSHLEADFRFSASQRAGIVSEAFGGLIDAVEAIARYFEHSDLVSAEEYSAFVTPWISSSRFTALAWAVPADGEPELDANGRVELYYQAPMHESASDIASILRLEDVVEAIFRAAMVGHTTVSRICDFSWDHPRIGAVVVRPVYDASDESGQRHIGMVIGLVSLANVADSAILSTEAAGLVTRIRDSEALLDAPVYSNELRIGSPLPPGHPLEGLRVSKTMEFADKTWIIDVLPSSIHAKEKDGSLPHSLFSGGMASLALSGFLYKVLKDRGKAEAEVAAKSADFETFFSTNLDMFAIVDMDGTFRRLNNQWKATLGYDPAGMLGTNYLELVHPDDKEASRNGRTPLSRDGELSGFVNRYRSIDGTYRSIEWHAILDEERKTVFAAARDISGRIKMEESLRRSLAEKETLIREVHHRVKNNMQIISSLLNLEAMKPQSDTTSFAVSVKEAQGRIRSMAMVHERLYRQDSVSAVDMYDYIVELSGHVAQEYGKKSITLSIEVGTITLDLDTAIPVGLLINELLTNAFKYACSDRNAVISIEGSLVDGTCTFIVADDGPGLPAGAIERSQAGDTLGLGLVYGLAQQLRGTSRVLPGPGARFEISFPYH